MYDYALLEALAAVVREGSFERAARFLHVTPSAVSQRVRLLEERVGQVLVVRDTPARATDAGARLCRHVEQVALLEQDLGQEVPMGAMGDASDGSRARVTLALAVNADSLATWFMPAAAQLTQAHSLLLDLRVEDENHTADALRSGEVAGAVTCLERPVPGCRSVPLGEMDYIATASPAFHAKYFTLGVTVESLERAPALQFSRRDRLQNAWAESVTGRQPVLQSHWVPSTQGFVDACRLGMGWGVNPEPLVREWLRSGDLVPLTAKPLRHVRLFWQCRQGLLLSDALTRSLSAAAAAVLRPMDVPSR